MTSSMTSSVWLVSMPYLPAIWRETLSIPVKMGPPLLCTCILVPNFSPNMATGRLGDVVGK